MDVIYGSATGLTATGSQYLTRNTVGGTGSAETEDRFGRALAAADFGRGATARPEAPDRHPRWVFGANSAGLPRGAHGAAAICCPEDLTAANLGSDPAQGSRDDLAIGVDGAGSGLSEGSGAVLVLYGARTGLSASGSELWSQDTRGVPGVAERRDNFGSALAGGVFDGGRYAALAIGSPTESIGHVYPARSVHVVRGSASGLQNADVQFWSVEKLGGVPEKEDLEFGSALGRLGLVTPERSFRTRGSKTSVIQRTGAVVSHPRVEDGRSPAGRTNTMAVASAHNQVLRCIHGARPANIDPDGRAQRLCAGRLLRWGRADEPDLVAGGRRGGNAHHGNGRRVAVRL